MVVVGVFNKLMEFFFGLMGGGVWKIEDGGLSW